MLNVIVQPADDVIIVNNRLDERLRQFADQFEGSTVQSYFFQSTGLALVPSALRTVA